MAAETGKMDSAPITSTEPAQPVPSQDVAAIKADKGTGHDLQGEGEQESENPKKRIKLDHKESVPDQSANGRIKGIAQVKAE